MSPLVNSQEHYQSQGKRVKHYCFALIACFLLFSSVACSSLKPLQSRSFKPTENAPSSPQQSVQQINPTPAHSFPNCSPVISPYFTKDALPFVIIPNPKTSQQALAPLAEKHEIFIGTAVSGKLLNDESYAALLSREFSMVTPEVDMKWENIHPEPDRYDFTRGDTIVAFARLHQMAVYGHV